MSWNEKIMEEKMSESLCKLIQRYEDKKYYGVCVLSIFLLMWLVVAFTGFAEIQSLFSNKHLGVIEAFLFTQIDLLSFQRSGIEILPDNSWRSISGDTFLDSFGYWYNAIYLAMWFLVFRLLISKELNALILDVDLKKAANSLRSISGKLKSYLMKEAHGIKKYSTNDLINRSISKNVPTNNTPMGVHEVNLERKASDYTNDMEDEPEHKQCPYCCEQILYRAIKCKHCGSELKPINENNNQKVVNTAPISNNKNSDITWKHYVGIGVVIIFIFYAMGLGGSSTSSKLDKKSAETLCRSYIAKLFYKPTSIIKTEHIKYDGGHFVKAYYYRPSDGDYFEFICSLDNNTIVWAAIFNGSDLGRWRYEDEMNYKRNESGSWILN
tara:strand:+ start:1757 stop:2902 length:1146 start_codon:yes stop_codon:yes gene_type:complete